MSVLIFRLNSVSDEEAEAVRALLEEHGFDFYESSAGRWGVSVAGLWLQDESEKSRARALIDQYQAERRQSFNAEPVSLASFCSNLWQSFKAAPLAFILTLLAIMAVAAISILPFIHLGDS